MQSPQNSAMLPKNAQDLKRIDTQNAKRILDKIDEDLVEDPE